MNTQIEICCDSYYGARQTEAGGAKRTESSSALHMGGSTLSVAILRLAKEHTKLSVMTTIRPRGIEFHYLSQDYDVTVEGIRDTIKNGADGIVFGYLDAYGSTDTEQSGCTTAPTKANRKQVVFHRAFDYVKDPLKAIETLINMGVDRVFASGIYPTAPEGKEIIRQLQERYDDRIKILAGRGIDTMNAKELITYTGVKQTHSPYKDQLRDGTTRGEHVIYSYGPQGHKSDYEVVNSKKVEHLIRSVR